MPLKDINASPSSVCTYTKGCTGSPSGNVFSAVTGTYIGTELVKYVNNTTWNTLWNKRCLCELTGENSGAVQTCNHRSSRHTPLIVTMAMDGVSWHHWNQGGISNKGKQIPNNLWKEEISLNIYIELSTMLCKPKGKESRKKNTRYTYRNFQWINQHHCNLTILPWKLHSCWTSLFFPDIFQKCDMGQSVKQVIQLKKGPRPFTILLQDYSVYLFASQ